MPSEGAVVEDGEVVMLRVTPAELQSCCAICVVSRFIVLALVYGAVLSLNISLPKETQSAYERDGLTLKICGITGFLYNR